MPTCLVVQHVAPESAFAITDALGAAGVHVDTREVFAGDTLPPDALDLDGLVVMGGPMSAASDEAFATRGTELSLIASAVRAGVPTLGVCLGAQLVAGACGAPVYPGEAGSEVGWSSVTLRDACASDPLFAGLPERLTVLQWHGDTFDLPPDAVHLMHNDVYPNQAFRIGDAAWGLQFHLEVTEEAVEGFVRAFGKDAVGKLGGTDAIRAATPAALETLAGARDLVLGRFADLVSSGAGRADLVGGATASA